MELTLDDVLAEEWDRDSIRATFDASWSEETELRACIAILGKRALAWMLENEWSASEYDDGFDEYLKVCPECRCPMPGQTSRRKATKFGHANGCEAGAILAEAKRLHETTGG